MGKDYYKILNVDKSADEEELKKAYRKLGKYLFLFLVIFKFHILFLKENKIIIFSIEMASG
jgi:hypothetical protein